ncbi:chromosomal replication initiation protein DnaA, partial [Mycobacterium tuberculosis]|nr:chromosomal replication initiation protein DnaA [Mycobacterium tuberculosis]
LGVRIAPPPDDVEDALIPPAEPFPGSDGSFPGDDAALDTDEPLENGEAVDGAQPGWPNYFTERPHAIDPAVAAGTSLN